MEEKKILLGIHEVNTELHDKLMKNKEQNEVIDIEDKDEFVDDEETVEFNLQQRAKLLTEPCQQKKLQFNLYQCTKVSTGVINVNFKPQMELTLKVT